MKTDETSLPRRPFSLVLMTTGGTIEKSYDELYGTFDNREGFIKQTLVSKLRLPHTDLMTQYLMNKDSLEMTDEDRQVMADAVLQRCQSGDCQGIVLLHGTDTMDQSARFVQSYLQSHAAPLAIPVVFTGAMSPYGLEQSDAFQNVVEAIMAVKLLQPGVYLSFHNQIFPAHQVQKNRQLKTFTWI